MIRLQYLATEHKNHAATKACFVFGRDSIHHITNSKKRQPLPTIQELVGHYSTKTTERYTHVPQRKSKRIESPIDRILKNQNLDNQYIKNK